jgi:hypothetical protein
LKKPEVAERIRELRPRSAVASSGDLDPEFVIQNLLRVLQKSVDSGRFTAANRTLELLGKFQGMFNDRRNDRREQDANLPDLDSMNPDQIFQYMRNKIIDVNPEWQLINRRIPNGLDGKRDELVRHLTTQLRNIDPRIEVIDPGALEVAAEATAEVPPASSSNPGDQAEPIVH